MIAARAAFALLMGLAVCGVADSVSAAAPKRALLLHDQARKLYETGLYAEAVEKLREALALDPKAKVLHYNLALIEERRGRIDEAIVSYEACYELEPSASERRKLRRTIERLEGAQAYQALERESPEPAPPPPALKPGPQPTTAHLGARPWLVVSAATAAGSFLLGGVLAACAFELDPGNSPTTMGGVTIEQLQADASDAHGFAIAADVATGVGVTGVVISLVLALVPPSNSDGAARPGHALWPVSAGKRAQGLRWTF